MAMVLAEQQDWFDPGGAPPFQVVVCGPFEKLREAVNGKKAEVFMWEHYTCQKYFNNGELKKLGEVTTPWNGWHVAIRGSQSDPRVKSVLYPALQQGLDHFKSDKEDAIDFITANMEYSKEDAEAWYDEVKYPSGFGEINSSGIQAAIKSLRTSGFIQSGEVVLEDFSSAS